MFQNTQNKTYLDIITYRVQNDYLTWCEQFLDLIESNLMLPGSQYLINDIGCNAGQFYKSLKRRNLKAVYRGFDIEQAYLDIAKATFPELV